MNSNFAFVEITRTVEVLARIPALDSSWLSDSEMERIVTLRIDARRNHYLAGHWLVRELLSQAFGKAPSCWSLQERKSLPPKVIHGDQDIRISISHSGDWIAAAVADVAMGIDIEQRPRHLDASIEALLLNADEMPGNLESDALLQRWVAKEAWLKAHAGAALPLQLKSMQLNPAPLECADVQIHSHHKFHFALAIVPENTTIRWGALSMNAGATYCVTKRTCRSAHERDRVGDDVEACNNFYRTLG